MPIWLMTSWLKRDILYKDPAKSKKALVFQKSMVHLCKTNLVSYPCPIIPTRGEICHLFNLMKISIFH